MADENKVQYIIELLQQGDTANARKELDSLSKSAETTHNSLAKLQSSAEELLAVFGVGFTLRESLSAFIEAEKVSAKLSTALHSTGQEYGAMRDEIASLTEELKDLTSFSGTEITNVIAKLVALGATKDSIRPLTEGVLDLSSLMDKDLTRSTQAMGRAMLGEFGSFTELGFHLNEAQSTGQKLNSVLQQIGETAGGQAKAGAETLGGEMEKLKKSMDEIKEMVGEGLANLAVFFLKDLPNAAAGGIRDMADAHDQLRQQLERYIELQLKSDKLTVKQADDIRSGLVIGFQGREVRLSEIGGPSDDPTAVSRQRDLSAEESAIMRASQKLGIGRAASTTATPAFDHRNIEEEKAALEHLSALRVEMAKATLGQLEQERIAVEENYNTRIVDLQKELNQAGITGAARTEIEKEAARERTALLDKVAQHQSELNLRASLQELSERENYAQREMELLNLISAAQLRGEDLVKFQMEATAQERMAALQAQSDVENPAYAHLVEMEKELKAAAEARYNAEHSFAEGFKIDLLDIKKKGEEAFAQGLSQSIVDAFSEGDKAFQKFASNFLKQIAQMILQSLILRAVQSVFGFAGGGQVHAAASGIQMISSPTYLPKFNTLMGEAGPELLTVLAHPQAGVFAGLPAQIGYVGPNRVAVVNAPRRMSDGGSSGSTPGQPATGPGGNITIQVDLGAGLEARIVQNSVAASVVQVTRQLGRDGALSQAARKLTT